MQTTTRVITLTLLFALVVLALGSRRPQVTASPESGPESVSFPESATIGGACRYGVTPLSNEQAPWIEQLEAGWYIRFHTAPASGAPTSAEFVPMLRLKPIKDTHGNYLPGYTVNPPLTESGLGDQVRNRPGSLWLVGNEVDRVDAQDDMMPATYAEAYHDIYHFIKERDQTAQVGISALVQVTPNRLQYLDIVWQSYLQKYGTRIPVDVWNMHLYILPETRPDGTPNGIASIAVGTNPALGIREGNGTPALCGSLTNNVYCWADHDNMAIFAQQVVAMRTWMKQHGEQHKPLIISEYSQLYPFLDYDNVDNPTECFLMDEHGRCWTPRRVTDFLSASFDYLDNARSTSLGYPEDDYRLVQQWLWFAINSAGVGNASNLVNDDLNALTPMGQRFRDEVLVRTAGKLPELYIGYTGGQGVFTGGNGTATATLTASVRNNGDVGVLSPFSVTFYRDEALQNPIGSATIQRIYGCGRSQTVVTTTWSGLGPGVHRYWVKADSQNVVPEANKTNNVGTGIVIVNPQQLFLPSVHR